MGRAAAQKHKYVRRRHDGGRRELRGVSPPPLREESVLIHVQLSRVARPQRPIRTLPRVHATDHHNACGGERRDALSYCTTDATALPEALCPKPSARELRQVCLELWGREGGTCSTAATRLAGLRRRWWPLPQPEHHGSVSRGCSQAISSVPKNMSGRLASLLCLVAPSRLSASLGDSTCACAPTGIPPRFRYKWQSCTLLSEASMACSERQARLQLLAGYQAIRTDTTEVVLPRHLLSCPDVPDDCCAEAS